MVSVDNKPRSFEIVYYYFYRTNDWFYHNVGGAVEATFNIIQNLDFIQFLLYKLLKNPYAE